MRKPNHEPGIFQTFLSYTIPCIIGMFLTSFITIVDGIFIGWRIGEQGLAAVNLTLPVLYLLLGLTIMVGVGGLTIATQSLGEGNPLRANQRFTLTMVLNLILNLAVVLALLLFLDPVIRLLNARGAVFGDVKAYLGTMRYFYIFMMLNIGFSMFIRGEGKPQLSLFFGIAGNLINILLDYLFIFRFDWGMHGAALASGLAAFIPFICGCAYFLCQRSSFRLVRLQFNPADLKQIIFNGSSELISQLAVSITTFLFNLVIIRQLGVQGVAAFTIVGYISLIEYMVLIGIAQGINPLISFSYGARDRERIMQLLAIALKSSLVVGAVTFLASVLATGGLIRLFSGQNAALLEIARYGLRIYAVSFLLNGYNIIATTYFTSLGNAAVSAGISLLRSLVLISVFILTLPYIFGDTGIWLTVPLTELLTFGVAYFYLKHSKATLQFNAGPSPLPAGK